MGIDEFERWWRARDRADIERLVAAVHPGPDADVVDACHVRACSEVEVALRRLGRRRAGCEAAHRARVAALDACRRTGALEEDRAGCVRLARAAGEAARALVCPTALPCLQELLVPFRPELAAP